MLVCSGVEAFCSHPLDPHTDLHPSILIASFKEKRKKKQNPKLITVVGMHCLESVGAGQWVFIDGLWSAVEHPVECSDKMLDCLMVEKVFSPGSK